MWILKRLGYTGLSMSELQPYLQGKKSGRVVGITFDDGYLNNLTHAAPILNFFNFSATCYVVSGLIGTTNSWDEELGVPSAPLMNIEHLKEWLNRGHEIGSHCVTHSSLLKITDERARFEIEDSKTQLERMLGVPVHQFCYPYGDYAKGHLEWVRRAGYWAATTTKRGRVVCAIREDYKMRPQTEGNPLHKLERDSQTAIVQHGESEKDQIRVQINNQTIKDETHKSASWTGNSEASHPELGMPLELSLELASALIYELPRVPVVRSTSWPQFLLKIATSYEDRHP